MQLYILDFVIVLIVYFLDEECIVILKSYLLLKYSSFRTTLNNIHKYKPTKMGNEALLCLYSL